jgi:hypothetical protein
MKRGPAKRDLIARWTARDEQTAQNELETLALEGLNSGDSVEAGIGYWEEKHRRFDERLKGSETLPPL